MTALTTPGGSTRSRAFGVLVATEAKLAWRQPLGPIFGLGMPLLGLIIVGVIPGANKPSAALHGETSFNAYVPIVMTSVLVALASWSLPIPLVLSRANPARVHAATLSG